MLPPEKIKGNYRDFYLLKDLPAIFYFNVQNNTMLI